MTTDWILAKTRIEGIWQLPGSWWSWELRDFVFYCRSPRLCLLFGHPFFWQVHTPSSTLLPWGRTSLAEGRLSARSKRTRVLFSLASCTAPVYFHDSHTLGSFFIRSPLTFAMLPKGIVYKEPYSYQLGMVAQRRERCLVLPFTVTFIHLSVMGTVGCSGQL